MSIIAAAILTVMVMCETSAVTSFTVIHGRVEDVLARGDLGKFDAVFCDPPYGIKFMGNAWDHGVPSADVWVMLREHIYPGSHVVAFGGTRKWHRLACNMEDSGLEMRDSILAWMYGQGWAKPANVSKYIDKALGAEREVTGTNPNGRPNRAGVNGNACGRQSVGDAVTAPATPEATTWNGWHGNLAPAWEPALLFREPGGTYAANALDHGVSGLNIDGNRIATNDPLGRCNPMHDGRGRNVAYDTKTPKRSQPTLGHADGRWPANVILCCEETICGNGPHQPGCPVFEIDAQSGHLVSGSQRPGQPRVASKGKGGYGNGLPDTMSIHVGDQGGASRFFYQAKVSRSERGDSAHPCMKPIALCRHIAGLLLQPPTRPRRLLVPYSGSGSEIIGALQAGWDEVVGIEADDRWATESPVRIAAEILAWQEARGQLDAETAKRATRPVQIGLFA